jgi:hypothetical protein
LIPLAGGGEMNLGWNDVVYFLMYHHAKVNAKDARGMTPIDFAVGGAGGDSRRGHVTQT